MSRHKELAKQWIDGAVIEVQSVNRPQLWLTLAVFGSQNSTPPHWSDDSNFRVKRLTAKIGDYDVPMPLQGIETNLSKTYVFAGLLWLTQEDADLASKAFKSLFTTQPEQA